MKLETRLKRRQREEEFTGKWPTMPRIRLTPADVLGRRDVPPSLIHVASSARKPQAD